MNKVSSGRTPWWLTGPGGFLGNQTSDIPPLFFKTVGKFCAHGQPAPSGAGLSADSCVSGPSFFKPGFLDEEGGNSPEMEDERPQRESKLNRGRPNHQGRRPLLSLGRGSTRKQRTHFWQARVEASNKRFWAQCPGKPEAPSLNPGRRVLTLEPALAPPGRQGPSSPEDGVSPKGRGTTSPGKVETPPPGPTRTSKKQAGRCFARAWSAKAQRVAPQASREEAAKG